MTDDIKGAFNEVKELVLKYPSDTSYRFINFPIGNFGNSLFKVFFEPYDMSKGRWPLETSSYEKPLFLAQVNGHIYDDPEAAKKAASTPWEHFYVAQFYLLKDDTQNGILELDKASVPKFDETLHYFTAVTYQDLGRANKALQELKKVVQINEYSIYAVDTFKRLSFLSFKTGDHDSTGRYLEIIACRDVEAMWKLAQFYESKGEIDKAKEIWKRELRYEDSEEIKNMIRNKISKYAP